MKVALVMAALLASCTQSHAFDGGRPDAGSDAGCVDRDGDGAEAASCGGDDCDDTDPALGPGRTRCDGPSTGSACEAGIRVRVDCAAVCDARSGTCADEACGDGVLQPGEACDDGNEVSDGCDPDCRFSRCVSDADCPLEAPSCSAVEPDGTFRCRALQPGMPVSTRCTSDTECASGFCDPEQGRCSHGCVEDAECGDFEAWCLRPEQDFTTTGLTGPHRCAYGCLNDAECPDGSLCTVPDVFDRSVVRWLPTFTFCRHPNPDGAEIGELTMTNGLGCRTWMWSYQAGPLGFRCTEVCDEPSDCLDPNLPVCGLAFIRPARPAGWRTPHGTVCTDQVR